MVMKVGSRCVCRGYGVVHDQGGGAADQGEEKMWGGW